MNPEPLRCTTRYGIGGHCCVIFVWALNNHKVIKHDWGNYEVEFVIIQSRKDVQVREPHYTGGILSL